jgi:nitroimidazol reductase NimA-like FMN-containing flavoprotein (pyridoxamine 5'-phosphate oxidase superfamily)
VETGIPDNEQGFAMIIREMDAADGTTFVSSRRIGRLACCSNGRPYVVPVHYVYRDGSIFSFTMPGQKLEFMRANPRVCLQVDDITHKDHWTSVIIEGIFREFSTDKDKQQAWTILREHNDWWVNGGQQVDHAQQEQPDADRKPVFFAISIDVVSGRAASAS